MDYEPRFHLNCKDFQKVTFLDVENRVDYHSFTMMFNVFSETTPSSMSEYIPCQGQVHCTRQSENAFVLLHVNTHGNQSFTWNGVKLMTTFPSFIKSVRSKDSNKYRCKKFLFDKMLTKENMDYVIHWWFLISDSVLHIDIMWKEHSHFYPQTVPGKMTKQMYGQWCILLGLLLWHWKAYWKATEVISFQWRIIQ